MGQNGSLVRPQDYFYPPPALSLCQWITLKAVVQCFYSNSSHLKCTTNTFDICHLEKMQNITGNCWSIRNKSSLTKHAVYCNLYALSS